MLTIVLLALFGLALCEGGNEFHLQPTGYKKFFEDTNAGTTYEGTTVFMEADLDFGNTLFYSIGPGRTSTYHFKGTFDGQGHVFSNLYLNHPAVYQYAGMFGYSSGMTVRNVVFDSSCQTESSAEYNGKTILFTKDTYIGGIMGYCVSNERPCIIENVVNMGSITFTHDITANLFLGGIAGHLSVSTYEVAVRNCANYGSISLANSANKLYIGGIAGYSGGLSANQISIQNCLNYGELSESGNMNSGVFIGGIFGESSYTYIENCVSGGRISSISSGSFGSIVGNSSSSTSIAHSFWTGDTGHNKAYGSGSSSSTDTYLITPGLEAVNNLNDYEFSAGGNSKWNKWLLNANNKTVTLHINNTNSISVSTQIILLPSTTVDSGYTFYWYTDDKKSKLLETVVISEDTTLYGGVEREKTYIVTFDLRGGESASGSGSSRNITRIVNYASPYGELPEVTKAGHTFNGWFTDVDGRGSEVNSSTIVTTASDHTIYACWTLNRYIVTFDFGNGTTTDNSFQFNSPIVYPEEVSEREGYTFNGWTPKPDTMPANDFITVANWTLNRYTVTFDFGNGTTTNKSFEFNSQIDYPEEISERDGYSFNGWTPKPVTMPANDLTIIANWTEIHKEAQVNSTEHVEIVFGSKDLKEEDVEMIIAKYTSDSFTIAKFERDEETGGIRVIVKFTDKENAESFVTTINNSSETEIINRASFIYDVGSFSPMAYPILSMFAYLFAF